MASDDVNRIELKNLINDINRRKTALYVPVIEIRDTTSEKLTYKQNLTFSFSQSRERSYSILEISELFFILLDRAVDYIFPDFRGDRFKNKIEKLEKIIMDNKSEAMCIARVYLILSKFRNAQQHNNKDILTEENGNLNIQCDTKYDNYNIIISKHRLFIIHTISYIVANAIYERNNEIFSDKYLLLLLNSMYKCAIYNIQCSFNISNENMNEKNLLERWQRRLWVRCEKSDVRENAVEMVELANKFVSRGIPERKVDLIFKDGDQTYALIEEHLRSGEIIRVNTTNSCLIALEIWNLN